MVSYRITSISTASLDRYPNNRKTKFTHFLPEILHLPRGNTYVIRLLSICIGTQIKSGEHRPAYISILLKQLDSKNFSSTVDKSPCLGQFVLPAQATSNYWLELDNPNPLLLSDALTTLQELSFEIVDEKNNELILDSAEPTVINCIIEEMERNNRFTLSVNQSLSRHLYPDNKETDFKVEFGHSAVSASHIENWEVALHSVIVPANITIGGRYFTYSVKNTATSVEEKKEFLNNGQTARTILEKLQTELPDFGVFIIRDGSKDYVMEFDHDHTTVHFDTHLCQILNMVELDGPGRGRSVKKSDATAVKKIIENFNSETSLRCPEQIAIYSDIVQSSVVGDDRVQLVDILSAEKLGLNDKTKDTLYNIVHPTFRPVCKPNVKNVSLKLANIYGQQLNLEHGVNDDNVNIQYFFVFRQ